MSTTIKVSNVSLKATEKDVHDFFSFSGPITSISTEQPSQEADHFTAFVTFQDEKPLETALLLSGSMIADKVLLVEVAEGYQVPPTATSFAATATADAATKKSPLESIQPTLKKAEEMMKGLLQKGYQLGNDAVAKAKAYDEKHELTRKAAERATSFKESATERAVLIKESAVTTAATLDEKYKISERLKQGSTSMNQRLQETDEKYHLTEKTKGAFETAESKLNDAGSYVLKNKYVATSKGWLVNTFNKISDYVEGPRPTVEDDASGSIESKAPILNTTGLPKTGSSLTLADNGPPVTPPAIVPSAAATDAPADALTLEAKVKDDAPIDAPVAVSLTPPTGSETKPEVVQAEKLEDSVIVEKKEEQQDLADATKLSADSVVPEAKENTTAPAPLLAPPAPASGAKPSVEEPPVF